MARERGPRSPGGGSAADEAQCLLSLLLEMHAQLEANRAQLERVHAQLERLDSARCRRAGA